MNGMMEMEWKQNSRRTGWSLRNLWIVKECMCVVCV